MSREVLLKIDQIVLGSCWNLQAAVNGYKDVSGTSLVTQAEIGRNFQIIHFSKKVYGFSLMSSRIMVCLLEDGYKCWLEISEIFGNAELIDSWSPNLLTRNQILERLPNVLKWLREASISPNKYLWGGTIGPDFDCSGLVQAAFASQEIWLPRDAYQQETFCEKVDLEINDIKSALPGDLIFFGSLERCNHVAVHINQGIYMHSSGYSHGSDGIALNSIYENDSISSYYRSIFRSIGRVCRCHDGTSLP